MKTKIIEAESNVNWGKFLVGIMDDEWERNSAVAGHGTNLLQTLGWTGQHFWMMDLSVGHGAIFSARYFPGDYSQGYREANYAIEKTKNLHPETPRLETPYKSQYQNPQELIRKPATL